MTTIPPTFCDTFSIVVCPPSSIEDQPYLEKIVRVINAAYQKHQWYLKRERIRIEELKTIIKNPKKRLYICLSSKNDVCGAVVLDFSQKNQAELGLFAIDPSYQGHNLGDSLLRRAETDAFEIDKVEKIILEVVTSIDKLVNYYKRHGYQIIGEIDFPDKSWLHPDFIDQIHCFCMEKCKS